MMDRPYGTWHKSCGGGVNDDCGTCDRRLYLRHDMWARPTVATSPESRDYIQRPIWCHVAVFSARHAGNCLVRARDPVKPLYASWHYSVSTGQPYPLLSFFILNFFIFIFLIHFFYFLVFFF